jgi:hypothetical protein
MTDPSATEITMADLFRVMNEMRKELSAFRGAVEEQFEAVDQRFDAVETRLERVENKLEG